MARGGGSGGRSGGGSFGGSRSGGGRSGGSFGGGSSFGGSIFRGGNRNSSGGGFPSGGMFGGSRSRTTNGGGFPGGGYTGGGSGGGGMFPGGGGIFPGGGGMLGRNTGGGGPSAGMRPGGCGCGFVIAIIIIILVIMLIFSMGSWFGSGNSGSSGGFGDSGGTDITKSTVVREALPSGSVNETDYYTDELGVIKDPNTLLEGMKYFYKKTGVQPYLVITGPPGGFGSAPSMEELDNMANELYDELFTDEAHLIFIYYEYQDSYVNYYLSGAQAKTVIDDEAGDILLDYMDRYYYDESLTYEAFFGKVFSESADRIMTVTRSPWIPVMIVLGIVLLAVLLFVWWIRAKKQKNLEAQQTEDILNIPLDKFGTTEAEKLAKKYEENNPKD